MGRKRRHEMDPLDGQQKKRLCVEYQDEKKQEITEKGTKLREAPLSELALLKVRLPCMQ